MNEPNRYLDLSKARTSKQVQQMEEIIAAGVCPFCPEFLPIYHPLDQIAQTELWTITPNMHPYEHTQKHLLAIPKRHMEHIADLNLDEWADFGRLMIDVAAELEFGGLAARFGDFNKTGATVSHLHFHLIEPEVDLGPDEKVRFRISK